ncbi:hypothetical protein BU23DRAFT_603557 [Bimuria novae-zelandiae CBS 107.79]|uniref:Uncharacterized protein n=1 Tax=Bimuria novae-zelandiae CBS 107.79 TaxID=1447943 RepID=A0A6A5UNY4_9PLEO|nr:hypothetical protein BU23DRAFT_603557 [Bimuria novae-zelandiae CBS 107.79]
MRAFSFTLLLFGLLGLLAVSVPTDWNAPNANSLGEYNNGLRVVKRAIEDPNLGLESKEDDTFDADLEKRRARGGRGRARPKKTRTRRPKKTAKKHKKTKTKRPKKTAKKHKKPKPKPHHKGKTSGKKPAKHTKPKKNHCSANGTHGKNSKHGRRATGDACPQPTEDYKRALQAAKKKGVRDLKLGKTYMLIHKASSVIPSHRRLIVGTVTQNSKGQLDFPAKGYELLKDPGNPEEIGKVKEFCHQFKGATCEQGDPIETWECSRQSVRRYSFQGEAIPEFADENHVKAIGDQLVARDTHYTVWYNNCWKFAKDAANVGRA